MKIKKVYLGRKQIYPEITRYVPNKNTIVYYDFENSLADKSGNNHNASINSGSPTYENIGSINVINLQGKYLSTGGLKTIVFNSNFTFSMWINFQQLGKLNDVAGDLIGYSGKFLNFQYESDQGGLCWYTQNRSNTPRRLAYNKPFQTNTWYNLTLVGSGSADPVLYVDGTKVTRTIRESGSFITLDNNPLYIGIAFETQRSNKNKYSDIFIENKQWTAQEISNYYENTKSNYGL